MGITHIAICDSKKEFFDPGDLGLGTKMGQWAPGPAGRALVSAMLTRWRGKSVRFLSDSHDEEYHDLTDGQAGYDNVTGEIWHDYHWLPEGERDESIEEDCRHTYCPVCKKEGESHRQNRILGDFLSFYRDQNAVSAAWSEMRFKLGGSEKKLGDLSMEDARQVLHVAVNAFLYEYQKVEKELAEPVRVGLLLKKLAQDVVFETSKIIGGLHLGWGSEHLSEKEKNAVALIAKELGNRARTILGEESEETK